MKNVKNIENKGMITELKLLDHKIQKKYLKTIIVDRIFKNVDFHL